MSKQVYSKIFVAPFPLVSLNMQVRVKFGEVVEPWMSKVEVLMNPAIFALIWRYVLKLCKHVFFTSFGKV